MEKDKDTSPVSLRRKFMAANNLQEKSSPIYQDPVTKLGLVQEYSNNELVTLANRHAVRQENPTTDRSVQFQELLSSFGPTHEKLVAAVADAERLQALDPNIKAAENIIVSSIISPNDLQSADPAIVINSPSLPQDTKDSISKVLSDYYCNEYGLGEKMTHWIRESLFRSGASVTLTLPEATLTSLIKAYDPDNLLLKNRGVESLDYNDKKSGKLLDDLYTTDLLDKLRTNSIYTEDNSHTKLFSYEALYGEPIKESTTNKISIPVKRTSDRYNYFNERTKSIALEAFNRVKETNPLRNYLDNYDINEDNGKLTKEFLTGTEKLVVKFTNDVVDSDVLSISDNPELLRAGKIVQAKQSNKFNNKLQAIFKNMDDRDKNDYLLNYETILDLLPHMTGMKDQKTAPFTIQIPTEAVIPICVPGSKSDHLGYFILVDSFGQPIEASRYVVNSNGCTISSRISAAYTAMYGQMPTESGIRSPGYGYNTNFTQNVDDFRKASLNKVFNYVLDEMLHRKLTDIGLTDVSVGMYNNVATCMLYRLFEKKKTSLVFVPKKYITYVAFDHHSDGTGKSKIEDLEFIESLKVVFLVANTMATMKNATPVKKVVLNLDEKQTNPLQTITALRNAIVQKEKLSISTYPSVISEQMIQQNLSIEAHAPDSQMSMTIEDTHREIPKADTEFLQELDTRSMIALDVPPSALSESTEVQFAKSLATTNLFFAKKMRTYQVVLEKFASEHIQTHASLTSFIVNKIAYLLDIKGVQNNISSTVATPSEDGNNSASTRIGEIAESISDDTYLKVMRVLRSIKIELPAPNVAPDQAQYDILSSAIKSLEDYMGAVYPDDLISNDYSDLADTFKNIKADIMSDAVKNVANQLGFAGLFSTLPTLETYALNGKTNINKTLGIIRNIKAGIKLEQDTKTMTAPEDTENEEGNSNFNF